MIPLLGLRLPILPHTTPILPMSYLGKKIGLALSGGGYRAATYHIGTLRALHRLGILDHVDVLSSVSGGSITAAYYALHRADYERFEAGLIARLRRGVLWSSFVYAGTAGLVLLLLSFGLGYLAGVLIHALLPQYPTLSGFGATLFGIISLFVLLILPNPAVRERHGEGKVFVLNLCEPVNGTGDALRRRVVPAVTNLQQKQPVRLRQAGVAGTLKSSNFRL